MSSKHFPVLLFLGFASVAAAWGCGSSDDPVEYKYPTYQDFCEAKAAAECSETVQTRCATDAKTCQTKRTTACLQSKPPQAEYQPKQAETCLGAVSKAYEDDQITPDELSSIEEACSSLFAGSKQVGDTCTAAYQCDTANGATCLIPPGKQEGTCQVPVTKEAGDPCDSPEAVCGSGLFCTPSDPRVCAKRYDEGHECDDTLLCKEDLACERTGDAAKGTCRAKKAVRESCQRDEECSSGLCAKVRICKGDDCHVEQQCVNAIILTPSDPACEPFT